MSKDLQSIEADIDAATTALLVPLRTMKRVDERALSDIKSAITDFGEVVASQQTVSKTLVGKLYFIFTSMLAEAEHARNPAPIITAAWSIEDQLTRIFGPHFG